MNKQGKALNTVFNTQSKDSTALTQKQTIFLYLKTHIATASMVSNATGIPQKNICRYKKDLEKRGLLSEIEKKACKITGFKAWYLTTNEEYFQASNQLALF
jgi:hypothetical protein